MPYILVRHKVKNYGKWKPLFDEHGSTRKQSGSKGGRLYRNADHPNEIVMIFEWDSHANAKKFAKSADLKEVMKKAGVSDKPDIFFLEEVEALTQ